MTQPMVQLQEATIKAQCKQLRMPMMAAQFRAWPSRRCGKEKPYRLSRGVTGGGIGRNAKRNTIARRIKDAHLPRVKTLEEFDYAQSPNVSAAKMRELAEGGYLERAEPFCSSGMRDGENPSFDGAVCGRPAGRRDGCGFATAAALVNELVEAKHQLQLRRVLARWSRYDRSRLMRSATCPWPKWERSSVPGDCRTSGESGP